MKSTAPVPLQHTVAASILHLHPEEYKALHNFIKNTSSSGRSPSPYDRQLRKSRTRRHLAVRVLGRGGGFAKYVSSIIKSVNPLHWVSTIKAIHHNRRAKSSMNQKSKDMAWLARSAYNTPEKRKDYQDYMYDHASSDVNHAVYHHKNNKRSVLSIKGTSALRDVLPDISILHGIQDKSPRFAKSLALYDKLQKEHSSIDVTGHSLGGTQAMWIGQKRNTNAFAYNPGFNAASDDRIETNHPKVKVHLVTGDPISNTILARPLNSNTVLLPSHSFRPSKNHGIDNFVNT